MIDIKILHVQDMQPNCNKLIQPAKRFGGVINSNLNPNILPSVKNHTNNFIFELVT